MFAGTQEILVLVVIALLLFVLPRLLPRSPSRGEADLSLSHAVSKLSGRMRLAVIASLLWPLSVAAYLKPWAGDTFDRFLYIGIGPVILGWSIRWIIAGFRKHKN